MPAPTAAPSPSDRPADQPGRDLLIDLARAGALGIVVLWHWVFTTIRFGADGPHVGNPVGVTPGMWLVTWFLQPMPIFNHAMTFLMERTASDRIALTEHPTPCNDCPDRHGFVRIQ